MDDKFLYQLREQPDSEFSNNLKKKLTQNHSRLKMSFQLSSINKKAKLAWVTTLVMVCVFAVATISPVRAFVSSLLTRIAGQSFEETENFPEHGDGENIIKPQLMSLKEAIAIFPHDITLPTNVPNEFTLDEDNVSVYTGKNVGPFADTFLIQWESSTGAHLTLNVSDHDWSILSEIVAPNSIEEIYLDDEHSAVLITGGWDADTKMWDKDMGILRLRWQVDGLAYDLHGNTNSIAVEQLMEIALSTY